MSFSVSDSAPVKRAVAASNSFLNSLQANDEREVLEALFASNPGLKEKMLAFFNIRMEEIKFAQAHCDGTNCNQKQGKLEGGVRTEFQNIAQKMREANWAIPQLLEKLGKNTEERKALYEQGVTLAIVAHRAADIASGIQVKNEDQGIMALAHAFHDFVKDQIVVK